MKSGATESCFYYLSQYYNIPEDVEISRNIEVLVQSDKKYKILWAHDNCDQPQLIRLPELASKIDLIVCVSNWEKEQYVKYNRAPKEKIIVIPNGVADIFNPKAPKSKTAIYFSAPHKGLVPIPKIWKQVIKNHPDAKLKVFSSHNLYGENYARDFEAQEHLDAIEELKSLPNVEYSPCIDREDLLIHVQDAAFFIHPNIWEETFCVSMAEAMSCGCYPITSDIGALREISFNRGKYIPMVGESTPIGWKVSPKFINEFAQEISRCFSFFDKEPHTFYTATRELSAISREVYDWKKISNEWKNAIEIIRKPIDRPKYFCMVNTERSQKYTHYAIKTFFENTNIGFKDKFYLIDNDNTWKEKYNHKIELIVNSSPKSFAENANLVAKLCLADEADFVLLSNDIIFTKNWIDPLVSRRNSISVPMCNQNFYPENEVFNIKPTMELEEYIGKEKEFNEVVDLILNNNIDPQSPNHIGFYCSYCPYEVLSKVGLYDETFGKGGAEDIDYRIRTQLCGFETFIIPNSYLLHFVGKSTWLGGETKLETEKRNKKYTERFIEKWGQQLSDILLLKNKETNKSFKNLIDEYVSK